MTMQDWESRLNRFIEATDREILRDAGKVTAEIAKAHAESEFEKYRIVQDRLYVSDFDAAVLQIETGGETSGSQKTLPAGDLKSIEDLEKDLKRKGKGK
jgi:hypothetical protein